MPSMTSGLPRSVVRWVSQVSVSVGATLVATMIYGALPKVTIPQLEPAPELTSGGKFAARALASEPLQAFDGLDTMPLPRVAMPAAVLNAAFFTGSTQATVEAPAAAGSPAAGSPAAGSPVLEPMHRTAGSGAPTRGVSAETPRTAKAIRPLLRADAKHAARVVATEAAAPEPVAQAVSNEPTIATDDGLLPKVMSSARGAWSVTASAGDALLAHVIPQMP